MDRRTKRIWLIGFVAVATVLGLAAAPAVASAVALRMALTRGLDRYHYCETGFSSLVNCTFHLSSHSVHHGTPDPAFATPSSPPPPYEPDYTDLTSWSVTQCPQNAVARRLLCPSVATPAASDDGVTGLPLPKPWLLTTARRSRFIDALHVETPLDLAATLRFYRSELGKRGWTEDSGAVVEPDKAAIAFMTSDGPARLRLIHQGDRTIADLSLRKSAAANAVISPGQVRLMLGNTTDEEAIITVNQQTVRLAARAGHDVANTSDPGSKSPDNTEIDLPPGKYKVTLKIASGAAENREFEVAANETWGLLVGPAGVPLPVHLH